LPGVTFRIISDAGPQFNARDYKVIVGGCTRLPTDFLGAAATAVRW
jgi:hypothetical protein